MNEDSPVERSLSRRGDDTLNLHSLCENIVAGCPSLFSLAVIKVHGQKLLVEDKVYLTFMCPSQSVIEGSQSRN